MGTMVMLILVSMMMVMSNVHAGDTNPVFDPCSDTKIQRWDGFTFGLAFSSKESFFSNGTQLSPCDQRLSLSGNSAQLAVFRPKVDEISLLTISSSDFNPVLEFQKGTLQNLFWKKFGCGSCTGDSFICLNKTDCAVPNNKCKGNGGSVDCNVGIQLAFSGTDKNDDVLNSWYEVKNLRQYSLYGLFQDVSDSLTSPFKNLF